MKKSELSDKISKIEGLTDEERALLLNLVNKSKQYGLIWEEKTEAVEEYLRTQLPVLKEVKGKYIKGSPKKQDETALFPIDQTVPTKPFPNHVLIEGDNLHALTTLSFTHRGKIDVIYIDPPYNTGNKDFKYNDSFVDKEDTFRHSKWLSFMHKRLKIAKNLLSDTGVIFISIDDNEQAQLKLLCDEILGEENFVGSVTIIGNPRGRDYGGIARMHDYLLVYSRTQNYDMNNIVDENHSFPFFDEIGGYELRELRNRNIAFNDKNRPNLYYPFYINFDNVDKNGLHEISLEKKESWIELYPKQSQGINTVWRWGKERSFRFLNVQIKAKKMKGDGFMIVEKYREAKMMARSVWTDKYVNTERGTLLLKEIMGNKNFGFPKPMEMIKRCVEMGSQTNSIILDFFAGSGTTLHAVMQLNEEDGGSRQCILVTNNENNICEEVTYIRNKKVIEGYTKPNGEIVSGLAANTLRYYQCEFVPSARIEENRRLLTLRSVELLELKENCYTDITTTLGFDDSKVRISTDEFGGYLVILFHSREQGEVAEQVSKWIGQLTDLEGKVKVYAFSLNIEDAAAYFEEVSDSIEALPLPEAIYNAYRTTFELMNL